MVGLILNIELTWERDKGFIDLLQVRISIVLSPLLPCTYLKIYPFSQFLKHYNILKEVPKTCYLSQITPLFIFPKGPYLSITWEYQITPFSPLSHKATFRGKNILNQGSQPFEPMPYPQIMVITTIQAFFYSQVSLMLGNLT